MNTSVIHPVILCGGSGTRLWPLSRTHYPTQFLRLVDDFSLLQNTLRRLDGASGLGEAIAVPNENHRLRAAEQLRQLANSRDARAVLAFLVAGDLQQVRRADMQDFFWCLLGDVQESLPGARDHSLSRRA